MRGLLLSGAFLAVVLAGCGKGGVVAEGKPDAGGAGGSQPQPREVDNPELIDATAADLDGFVAKHKGLVVTVDFWSVDDKASKERVVEAVSYYDHHKTFGLRTAFVCVDPPAKREAAKAFLAKQEPMFANLFVGDMAAGLADKYGFAGKVPHQVVFARDGSRAWKTGEVNPHTLGAAPSGDKKGKAPIDPQGAAREGEDKESPASKYKALLNFELDKVVR